MQASNTPCLIHSSLELKNGQPPSLINLTHLPSCSNPPIALPPGAGHLDNLLFCGCQTALYLVNSVGDDHQYDEATLNYLHAASASLLKTHPVTQQHTLWSAQQHKSKHGRNLVSADQTQVLDTHRSLPSYPPYDVLYQTPKRFARALTHLHLMNIDIMTAVVGAPGSPPDLSESRSSKTSSYASEFSSPGDTAGEGINFEEITLEDDESRSQGMQIKAAANRSPTERQQAPYFAARRSTTSGRGQSRRQTENGPRSAPIATSKIGFTSPSATALTQDTISTSPPQRLPRSTSTSCLIPAGMAGSGSQPAFASISRRGSWQPRKTIKEIEAEFHDSDDELPEDASLWNVPISPFLSGPHSARSSARGSPNRGPVLSPQPLPLEHVQSLPESPPRERHLQTSSRHRLTTRSASAHPSQSSPKSPRVDSAMRTHRTKSWNAAMTDLSVDARILSQNLEYHAEQQGKNLDLTNTKEQWFSFLPQRSSAPGAIQLPPIQRGALDFMPISKEKEAILSRTRPSWLPPKDPREEKKHLKEYQRMMAASIEAEKKRKDTQRTTVSQKDETQARIDRIWDYYIDPTTNIVDIDRRVHDLCWRGISPRIRGQVWQRKIGNPLGLSRKTYSKALERAKEVKNKASTDLSRHERGLAASFSDIERDAETAFPELNVFQRNGPLWQDLIDLCEAHACYRGDIGHLYGIQLIGALMLLQVRDPADAFILMENCLNSPIPLAFLSGDIASIERTYTRIMSTLALKFRHLHAYLFELPESGGLGLTCEAVLEPMLRTMFSNGLDVDRLCRVWDIWVFEGDLTLVETAVAILGNLQDQIFEVTGDIHLRRRNVQEMLGWGPFNRTERGLHWQLRVNGNEDAFVESIRTAGTLDYTGR